MLDRSQPTFEEIENSWSGTAWTRLIVWPLCFIAQSRDFAPSGQLGRRRCRQLNGQPSKRFREDAAIPDIRPKAQKNRDVNRNAKD